MAEDHALVGIADHCGWAVAVAVGAGGALLDRRRITLVGDDLPAMPHHHEAQGKPAAEAEAIVARVRASAEAHAAAALDALAAALPVPVAGIALRADPARMPATVAERVASYHAQTRADGVMYRQALADAAIARGWRVARYERKRVDVADPRIAAAGRAAGRPWTQDHQVAMGAAIAAVDD